LQGRCGVFFRASLIKTFHPLGVSTFAFFNHPPGRRSPLSDLIVNYGVTMWRPPLALQFRRGLSLCGRFPLPLSVGFSGTSVPIIKLISFGENKKDPQSPPQVGERLIGVIRLGVGLMRPRQTDPKRRGKLHRYLFYIKKKENFSQQT
jgi:hypothetical protein